MVLYKYIEIEWYIYTQEPNHMILQKLLDPTDPKILSDSGVLLIYRWWMKIYDIYIFIYDFFKEIYFLPKMHIADMIRFSASEILLASLVNTVFQRCGSCGVRCCLALWPMLLSSVWILRSLIHKHLGPKESQYLPSSVFSLCSCASSSLAVLSSSSSVALCLNKAGRRH